MEQAKADLDKEKKLRNLQIDKLQGPGDNNADHPAQSASKSSQQDEKIEKLMQQSARPGTYPVIIVQTLYIFNSLESIKHRETNITIK